MAIFHLISNTCLESITGNYNICLSDLLMTEVVHSFIVGHWPWAVPRELTVTERHVARSTTNIIEIENHDERKRPGMLKELYTLLVKNFSLEGNLIFDLGIGNDKYICYVVPWSSWNVILVIAVIFENIYLWNENRVFNLPWTVIFFHVISREIMTSAIGYTLRHWTSFSTLGPGPSTRGRDG